jgi:hypothetical protein
MVSLERGAIVLEFVSFFCVTIDLYGVTRILDLQRRMGDVLSRLRDRTEVLYPSVDRVVRVLCYSVALALAVWGAVNYALEIPDDFGIFPLGGEHAGYKLFSAAMIAFVGTAFLLAGCISVLWFIGLLAVDVPYLLLVRWRLDGILLAVGVLLFVVSKSMSYLLAK